MSYFKLHNSTVGLRPLEPTDIDLLTTWENDTRLWSVTSTSAPYSRHAIWQYLEHYTADIFAQKQLRLMIILLANGEGIGTVDLFNLDPLHRRVEIGLFIHERYQGQGYGTEALNLAIDYLQQHVGLHQLYATIEKGNRPCIEIFRNRGFSLVGTLRDWVRHGRDYSDAQIWQLILL